MTLTDPQLTPIDLHLTFTDLADPVEHQRSAAAPTPSATIIEKIELEEIVAGYRTREAVGQQVEAVARVTAQLIPRDEVTVAGVLLRVLEHKEADGCDVTQRRIIWRCYINPILSYYTCNILIFIHR